MYKRQVHTAALDAAIAALQAAVQRAHALLAPPSFTIAATCPSCGHRYAEFADGTRRDTLKAHGDMIVCDTCEKTWRGTALWELADAIRQETGSGE